MTEFNILRLKNDSSVTIGHSTLVYLTNATTKTFDVANPVSEASCNVIGMTQFAGAHNILGDNTIVNGDWANIITSGTTYHSYTMRDETAWYAGDKLYLSTEGYLTNTPTYPTNTFMVNAGVIEIGRCLMDATASVDAVIQLNIQGEVTIPVITENPCTVLKKVGSMCLYTYSGDVSGCKLCIRVDSSTIRTVETDEWTCEA